MKLFKKVYLDCFHKTILVYNNNTKQYNFEIMEKNSLAQEKTYIFLYFRHELYNHMLRLAKNGTVKYKGDNSFHLFEGLSLILMNCLEEGIHNLEMILSENDVKLAAAIALKHSHKLIETNSKELFLKLDEQIKDFCQSSDTLSFYNAAFTLMALKQPDTALEYIDKAITLDNEYPELFDLKGWILIELGHQKKDANEMFQKSLQLNPRNLDANIGISECYFKQKNFMEALSSINKAVVQYSLIDIPLMQKLKIQLGMQDWDQVLGTINRILSINPKNIYARKLYIVVLLCYSADYEEAIKELDTFIKLLDSEESKNAIFILQSSKLFSKICNKNWSVLQETIRMLENILQFSPENIDVLVELGSQFLIRNQFKEASRYCIIFCI